MKTNSTNHQTGSIRKTKHLQRIIEAGNTSRAGRTKATVDQYLSQARMQANTGPLKLVAKHADRFWLNGRRIVHALHRIPDTNAVGMAQEVVTHRYQDNNGNIPEQYVQQADEDLRKLNALLKKELDIDSLGGVPEFAIRNIGTDPQRQMAIVLSKYFHHEEIQLILFYVIASKPDVNDKVQHAGHFLRGFKDSSLLTQSGLAVDSRVLHQTAKLKEILETILYCQQAQIPLEKILMMHLLESRPFRQTEIAQDLGKLGYTTHDITQLNTFSRVYQPPIPVDLHIRKVSADTLEKQATLIQELVEEIGQFIGRTQLGTPINTDDLKKCSLSALVLIIAGLRALSVEDTRASTVPASTETN